MKKKIVKLTSEKELKIWRILFMWTQHYTDDNLNLTGLVKQLIKERVIK